MSNEDDFRATYLSYRSRDNQYEQFVEALSSLSGFGDLSSATRCLIVGPGSGRLELKFIKTLLPKIKTLTAVEPDVQSALELRSNIEQTLPGVDYKVYEEAIESWNPNFVSVDQSFDVILLFSVLILVETEYCRHLCQNLLRQWVSPSGVVIFSMMSQSGRPDSLYQIFRRLNADYRVPTYEDFHEMLTESKAGFHLDFNFEVRYRQDLTNPDEGVLGLFRKLTKKDVKADEVQTAVFEIWPQGTSDQRYQKFGFYRRSGISE